MRRRKRPPAPWSKAAERELFNGVGISGVEWFKQRCGKRSRSSIYQKLRREYGPGGLTRGVSTLHELEKQTGYSECQIRRAGGALNQKWKRLGPRGAHLITEEQVREIVTWLGHDFWSKRHRLYGCSWCQTVRMPHHRVGLCERCYYRHRRLCGKLGLPAGVKAQAAVLTRAVTGRDIGGRSGRFKGEGAARLAAGLALSRAQLDWLAMLAP